MKIHIIVVRTADSSDSPWIVNAFDEYTMDEDPSAFQEALDKERASHGPDRVAVGIIHVSSSFLDKLFLPRETTALEEEKGDLS